MTPLFEAKAVHVRFGGVVAVDHADLEVEEGSLVGLIGPNGAGKTTFIDAVTGLVPAGGQFVFQGVDISSKSPHARANAGLGRTFQSLELFEELTVRENLLVAADHGGWWRTLADLVIPATRQSEREAVDRALDLLDLGPLAGALPAELSLGDRKLVSVARSLAADPKLLLLDEPAAGLDTAESQEFGRRLRKLVDSGVSMLLVDHDVGLVLRVCDYIYVLQFGAVIAAGTPAAIRDNPTVIGAYLGHQQQAPAGAV